MKKWMYLVFPGVMLAAFLVLYFMHEKDADIRERQRTEAVAKKDAEDKKQKAEAEAKAQADAQKRQQEREEEERAKEETRRKKQEAADKEVRDRTNATIAEADKSAKDAASLEIELDRMHKQRDQLSRETFDLAKQVERAKVDKRNAEMEEQRMTEMIARRAAESSIARLPPPPPIPAAKS
jgi:uncharacterized membrane protein YgaE (UPF0421/DUF939 family)